MVYENESAKGGRFSVHDPKQVNCFTCVRESKTFSAICEAALAAKQIGKVY